MQDIFSRLNYGFFTPVGALFQTVQQLSFNRTFRTYRTSQGIWQTHDSSKFYGRCNRTSGKTVQQLLWSSIYTNDQSVRATLNVTKYTHAIWNTRIGWTFTTAFKSYGDDWHKHRRLLQQTFKPSASLEYRPKQAEKVIDFIHDLLEDPDKYMVHIRKWAFSYQIPRRWRKFTYVDLQLL